MPTRCQDCNSHFLLDNTTVVNGVSCPDCGGTRLERDQPSPTHSDGQLTNMVDPATQIDAGGNPLQEGVWAGVDGGWQPAYKRDEFFAKTAMQRIEHPELVCENCKRPGGVGLYPAESVVQCRNCGFVGNIGSDMGLRQRMDVEDYRDHPYDFNTPGVPDNLGPVHQGRTAAVGLSPSGIEPQHHGTAQPVEPAGLHNGNLFWLHFLDASINGKPVREHHASLFLEHGMRNSPNWLKPVTVSVHHPDHLPAAIEAVQTPQLTASKESLVHAPTLKATGQAVMQGRMPPPPGITPSQPQAPPVMSNHYSRSLSQDPYLPWYHQADVKRYPGDGGAPTTLTNEEWASDKRQKYLDRQNGGHRLNWQPGTQGRGIMIGSSLHTWPIEKTQDNPMGGLGHGEYVRHLGVNPINVDMKRQFEIEPDGTMVGANVPPEAAQIDPNLREGTVGFDQMFGKTAFLPAAPLAGMGARLLLGQAIGGLMRKAIHGAGNFLDTAPQPDEFAQRPVGLVASEKTAVGVGAPVETPHSQPDLIEDHDPEAVDQHEYNDGDMSPDQQNPNLDVGDGGLSQGTGEDATKQKLEFRHDGDAVSQAELLLPLILEFVNSEKSGLDHPQLKALHEALDAEIPGYLDHASEDDEAVQKLLDELRKPHEGATKEGYMGEATMPANNNPQADFIQQALRMVEYYESIGNLAEAEKYKAMAAQAGHHFGAGVYQNTMIPPAQMQMGNGQMAMPGTHQNPIQPGGMPVSGKCTNCGGVTNADGSCPQCGAAAGANQQGNLNAPGQQQTPLGIMPSPYAHTSADHQGPITPQQKQVFAEYLIEQGRNNEVAAMMANPGMYADEWAQYLNKSTQPPEVDPSETPPPPVMDPSQMGQMPVPSMSIPQPTAASVEDGRTSPHRCPNCTSATTNILNSDGDMRCHRCGHIWSMDVMEDHPVVSNWKVKALVDPVQPDQSPANPVAAPAADATAPGDPEDNQDSSLSWKDQSGQPLQVGQTYQLQNPGYAIPDIVKIQQVKPDSIVVAMEGEYNAPSDSQDANGPEYTHEIPLQEAQTEGLIFTPMQTPETDEQSQDQGEQDGVGQTVNTEPVEQPHDSFPTHANFVRMAPMSEYDQYFGGESGAAAKAKAAMVEKYGEKKGNEVFYATVNKKKGSQESGQNDAEVSETLPTDHCPKCDYGHVTSSYLNPETIQYECFRCSNQWVIEDKDEGSALATESREWLNEDDSSDFNFDRVIGVEAAKGSKGRDIRDIAAKDPRHQQIKQRLDANGEERTAGAKFSPREQKEFIDEDGTARNADKLQLSGTHYVESAFDLSKANPDKVNDNYIGLGL